MVVALLVVGGLGMPVTGLLVAPDVRGARHGARLVVDVVRFGCLAVSVVVLAVALVGVVRGNRGPAAGAATALLALTLIFATGHVAVVTTGMFHGDGRPLLAAVAAVAGLAAATALVVALVRLRPTG